LLLIFYFDSKKIKEEKRLAKFFSSGKLDLGLDRACLIEKK